ncbi:ubiquinol--cytochrome-c reductase subunit 6 [Lodderomyces elongisporus]|uniref:ubiquinol--cytochrome-c reductase subunit 6 n=1 Tax=Lodderomyces elongisporus TaxID=36914 RepID=UPI0029245F9A|nr:ubiquinol--cytochrome-c reductase subunit 6 [Lodderomyces elongisporus]WLF78282.1 ubiquinol--cytochrome-c reductase subunit 6 [Lodderomyces elongisporus]
MSFLKDLLDNIIPTAYADEKGDETQNEVADEEAPEAQEEDAPEETPEEETVDDGDDEDEDDDDEDDEDDEDEEELVDPQVKLNEECAKTIACKPFEHHFHECIERVTKEMEEPDYAHKHYKEDCVEEFFHLQHCVNDCVAPKLFNKLK